MSQERRRFFRINDTLGLNITAIPVKDEISFIDNFFKNLQEYSTRNEFNYQIAQHQSDLQHIENKMPELARYLVIMQKQLDLLSEKLLTNQNSFEGIQQKVNLSAQGMSLQTPESRNIGELVELQLQLMPSKQKIAILARIVQSEINKSATHSDKDGEKFVVSLDFEHIHDADQEILVKHVHSLQLKKLGNAMLEID